MGVLPSLLPGIGSPPIIGRCRQKEKQRFAREALGKLPFTPGRLFRPTPQCSAEKVKFLAINGCGKMRSRYGA
jgi:hypothetical protein